MVERGSNQAHRPGHVREDLIPKNWTGRTEPRLDPPGRTDCFNGVHPLIVAAKTRTAGSLGTIRFSTVGRLT